MLRFGSHADYEWLATDNERLDLLDLCPEIVRGKYVAITSNDSSVFVLNETERNAGWESRNKIAYSPKVQSADVLPREGWDEWYVFKDPVELGVSHLAANIFETPDEKGHVRVFVNYCFSPHLPATPLTAMFWRQLERIRPESIYRR